MRKIIIITTIVFLIIIAGYWFWSESGCNYQQPGKTYFFKSPQECERGFFTCATGEKVFQNECGCGCLKTAEFLGLECDAQEDCREYIAHNTCQVFCANQNKENQKVLNGLEKVCDSTLWDRSYLGDCVCVENKCKYVIKE